MKNEKSKFVFTDLEAVMVCDMHPDISDYTEDSRAFVVAARSHQSVACRRIRDRWDAFKASADEPAPAPSFIRPKLYVERLNLYRFHGTERRVYVVKSGDTFSAIAYRYNRYGEDLSDSVYRLWALNVYHLRGKSPSEIYPGEIIFLD